MVETQPKEGGIPNVDVSSMKDVEKMSEEKATQTANNVSEATHGSVIIKVVQQKLALTNAGNAIWYEVIFVPFVRIWKRERV